MVVSAAASAGRLGASREFGHVGGDIDHADVGLVLGLGGGRQKVGEEGHHDEADNQHVQADRNDLSPAEVFVLAPDVLYADGLYFKGQRWLFGRGKDFLEARAEAAEAFHPTGGESAVGGTLGNGPAAEKFAEVGPEPTAILVGHQIGFHVTMNLDGAFKEELLKVGPKVVRHQNVGPAEARDYR